MIFQNQLSQDHPGQQLEATEENTWWLIKRQKQDEPSLRASESGGIMRHKDEIFEVYNVDLENKVTEADHVKTNDETIVPGHLTRKDKKRAEGVVTQLAEAISEKKLRGWR